MSSVELLTAPRRLTEATRLLTASLDPRQVLDRFAALALELTGADVVRIWLLDGDGPYLSLAAQAGELRPDVELPHRPERDKGLTGAILSGGRPLALEDLERDERVWNRAWYAGQGLVSFLGAPLIVDGAAVGFMGCTTRTPRAWSDDDVDTAEALAMTAAVAIRNARLHAETRAQLTHNETLLAVARAANSTLDFAEAMRRVARAVGKALGADMVGAYLPDAEGKILRPVAGYHVPPDMVQRFLDFALVIANSSYIEEGWRTGQPAFCADAQNDPRSDPALVGWVAIRSIIFFPLIARDQPIGALFLIWWAPRVEPTAAEFQLLEGIARQTALAIGNARLVDELQRRLRETEALLGVADSVVHARDVGEIMRRVCREAARALRADCAVFYVVDEAEHRALPVAGYHVPKDVLAGARPLSPDDIPAPIVRAHESGDIVFVPDVQADGRFATAAFGGIEVRALLMSPIASKERLFGNVLLFWWRAGQHVNADDLALMRALSAQAALALENARLLVEIQSQATAMREKNAELDSFVYTVSHDLKAPLVTIQGMSGMVLEEYGDKLDDDGKHYLQRIVANTQQMERLILDLLALSRCGREGREPEELDLRELVTEIVGDLAERLQGIEVVVGELPTVWGVRVQMDQVLRNLLTNAIKYMGECPAPTIELGSALRGTEVEVWVRDTGIGIDPAYHEKVFEIFQRLKEVEAEGSGVGLPIVKKIVAAAGGRIWVESARGQGSTFRFTWPIGSRR
jgi:signal transduction histidine kinase